jgi:hypothetical protein
MAEWIGPRHRKRGTYEEPEPIVVSETLTSAPPVPQQQVEAPGAVTSPQMPGEVPDRSTIPGEYSVTVEPAPDAPRPLTEYQTAQRIMGVFRAEPGNEREPARFEQATAAFEELRKADPAQWPVGRPQPGYVLDTSEPIERLSERAEGASIEP